MISKSNCEDKYKVCEHRTDLQQPKISILIHFYLIK